VHDVREQLPVGDVGELDVDVNAKARFGCAYFGPALVAAWAYVELDLVAG
jgi:hypothetical protein